MATTIPMAIRRIETQSRIAVLPIDKTHTIYIVGHGQSEFALMGRNKLYHERMVAAFSDGTFKKIRKVLGIEEDRTDFVRAAVEMLLELRSGGANPAGTEKRE